MAWLCRQIVEPDARQRLALSDQAAELVSETARLKRFAVGAPAYQSLAGLTYAQFQKLLGLPALKFSQFAHGEDRQANRPDLLGLGRLEP